MTAWLWAFVALVPALIFLIWCLLSPRPTSIPLRSRHVVITGGSSGIGLCLAQLVSLEGARVSIVGRSVEKLTAARECILDWHLQGQSKKARHSKSLSSEPHVHFFSADVKQFSSIEKALADAVVESGPIDVLITSHGVSRPQTLQNTPLEEIYHMLDTNLKGNLHTIKAAIPHMINRTSAGPGSISIVSSQAAQVSLYGYGAYSASKCGLRGLAEGLQQELLPHNIRLSLIYPPDTKTPGFIEENKSKPELTGKLSESSKCMEPMDVAKKALSGVKQGHFCISCNFDGLMLSTATAGMSPQPSLPHALLEICFMGLMRIVALVVLAGWFKTVMDWHRSQIKRRT